MKSYMFVLLQVSIKSLALGHLVDLMLYIFSIKKTIYTAVEENIYAFQKNILSSAFSINLLMLIILHLYFKFLDRKKNLSI